MNDDELRAFLESATVGDDGAGDRGGDTAGDEGRSRAETEPTVVLPPAPGGADDRVPSFDELIASGAAGDEDLAPIVLPGPASAGKRPFPFGEPAAMPAPKPAPKPAQPAAAAPQTPKSPAAPKEQTPAPARPAVPAAAPAAEPVAAPVAAPTVPISAGSAASMQIGPPTAPFPGIDDDYEKISVTGGERRTSRFVPWIIVGAGAVIALVVAILIVGSLSGGGSEPAPTAAPTTESQQTQPSTPGESDDPDDPGESTQPTRTPPTAVPEVEVGPTMNMPVAQWGIQVDLSQRLGLTVSYSIPDGVNLVLASSLIDSLPASCSKEWGMTRVDDSTFEVYKPAERCEAAPALYDELWGLMDAMAKSARPL